MELGRRMGMHIPAEADIHVFAVEVRGNLSFGERLSPELERAVPQLRRHLLGEIEALLATTRLPEHERDEGPRSPMCPSGGDDDGMRLGGAAPSRSRARSGRVPADPRGPRPARQTLLHSGRRHSAFHGMDRAAMESPPPAPTTCATRSRRQRGGTLTARPRCAVRS